MVNCGILNLHHLFNENGYLKSYQELCDEFLLDRKHFMSYAGLCHAIPKAWKTKIKANCSRNR